uniref:Uncharacterized protein n=1 Tax=Moorena producens (strain JHB) TaxID=1454205 RepID=A0A1D9G4F1_MOOP1
MLQIMRSAVQGTELLLAWAFRVLLRHDWDLGMRFGKADPTGTHLFLSPLVIAVLIVMRYTGFFSTSDFPTPKLPFLKLEPFWRHKQSKEYCN